ncbi:hypothetical protein R5M92_06160 [Halomonas sp. Bachu 37]|uniref:hypothetical protein n=1 Tax=Halomonas kashgarensis TaxID=3084920 RepID=UPI003216C5F7
MQKSVRRWATGLVIGVSITALSGCGTMFYPERKGQLSGDIDPVVAVANGVGLLFYIVPGVIAYVVDFSNGTIYLPNSHNASVDAHKLDASMDMAALEQLLSDRAGQPVSLESELVMTEEVETLDEGLALVRMSGIHDDERLSTL